MGPCGVRNRYTILPHGTTVPGEVKVRSFVFWALFAGLLLAGYDGVRGERERRSATPTNESSEVHVLDDGTGIPPPKP